MMCISFAAFFSRTNAIYDDDIADLLGRAALVGDLPCIHLRKVRELLSGVLSCGDLHELSHRENQH